MGDGEKDGEEELLSVSTQTLFEWERYVISMTLASAARTVDKMIMDMPDDKEEEGFKW